MVQAAQFFVPPILVFAASTITAYVDLTQKLGVDASIARPLRTRSGKAYVLLDGTVALTIFGILLISQAAPMSNPWLLAVSVILGYPLVVRSKFFTLTTPGKDTVSVGFEELYNRYQGFFFNRTLESTKILAIVRDLVRAMAEALSEDELKVEANELVRIRPGLSEADKSALAGQIDAVSKITNAVERRQELARLILVEGGFAYVVAIFQDHKMQMPDLVKRQWAKQMVAFDKMKLDVEDADPQVTKLLA